MKKILVFLSAILISFFSVQGQTWETIGSGVADFLLSNPKTADKMKTEHQVALSIIGDLLNTTGQRKHEINVAEAGKTQINLTTNSGQQIQLVMDANGSVYALSNNIIYPIAQNIVNEAKNFVLNQQPGYMDYVKNNNMAFNSQMMLPGYNYSQIKDSWEKKKTKSMHRIILDKQPFFVSDVLTKFEANKEDLYVYHNKTFKPFFSFTQDYNRYRENKKSLYSLKNENYAFMGGFSHASYLYIEVVDKHEKGTFTAKWKNDMNNNSTYEFNEFQDIRRNFYEKESFLIAAGLNSQYDYSMKLSIFEQLSGKLVYNDILEYKDGFDQGFFSFNSYTFKSGIYNYHISCIRKSTNEELMNYSEKFQILSLNQKEKVENKTKPLENDNSTIESASKEKMINDLIQLLKEGKISEETFKVSMKALEEKY